MILRMLIENECHRTGLGKEHGISLFIEFQERKLLFDTGGSGEFIENASKMGVDLRNVDNVIISHAHSDHSGGLSKLLRINDHAPVFISENSKREYYVRLLFPKVNVSAPSIIFSDYSERLRFVNEFTKIDENIFLVTKFIRKYPLTKPNRELLVKYEDEFRQDEFDHEMALVMINAGKLVIITGCSHNGVENMVESIIGIFPGFPIQMVIGGFHLMGFPFHKLMGESRANITELGKRLLDYGVQKTYTCHCTGVWGFNVLKDIMGDRIEYFSTGMQIEL